MKRIASAAALIAFCLAAAGTYRSSDGNVTITYGGISYEVSTGQTEHVRLSGGVTAISGRDGVRFSSQRAICLLNHAGKATDLQSIDGQGAVKIVHQGVSNGDNRTTTLTSERGSYKATPVPTATAQGNVKIVDQVPGQSQVVVATGNDLIAKFSPTVKGKKGTLQAANLTGNVRIEANKIDSKGKPSKIVANGSKLEIDYTRPEPTITLTGKVHVNYVHDGGSSDLDENRVVLILNRKGFVTSLRAGSAQ